MKNKYLLTKDLAN